MGLMSFIKGLFGSKKTKECQVDFKENIQEEAQCCQKEVPQSEEDKGNGPVISVKSEVKEESEVKEVSDRLVEKVTAKEIKAKTKKTKEVKVEEVKTEEVKKKPRRRKPANKKPKTEE